VRVPPQFDTFYADNYRQVVALVYTLSGSTWGAEDIAQEAFLTAHRDWERVGQFDSVNGWIRTVAMNLARSRWRRAAAEARALRRWVGLQPAAFPALEPDHELFWKHVRALPRRQAEVVALHYLEDLSVADIATMLGIAESSVKNSLVKARASLAQRLPDAEVTS
jgi:RNA polymerase sigma-70 factor (ECF subfamily)